MTICNPRPDPCYPDCRPDDIAAFLRGDTYHAKANGPYDLGRWTAIRDLRTLTKTVCPYEESRYPTYRKAWFSGYALESVDYCRFRVEVEKR